MGSAARAAAPRAGVRPVVPRTYYPGVRVAPRIVTGYPYRPYYRSYYRPYYPYYRPGFSVGFYSGYPAYGYGYGYGLPYDYPNNYTYFVNPPYYEPYRHGVPGYVAVAPGYNSYGGVKIDGAPANAQVYVDGYYAGIVNDFDGTFQHMNLRTGPHRIEVRPDGLPPVSFNVNVQPGQTLTYHAGIR